MIHKNLVNCLIIVLLLFLCATVVVPAAGNDSSVELLNTGKYWNGKLTVDMGAWGKTCRAMVPGISVTYYDKYMKYLDTEVILPSKTSGNKHIYDVCFDKFQGIAYIDICLSVDARWGLTNSRHTLHEHVARYNARQLMMHEVCLGTAVTDGHYVVGGPDRTEVHWMDNKAGSYTTSLKGGECYGKQTQIVTIGKR